MVYLRRALHFLCSLALFLRSYGITVGKLKAHGEDEARVMRCGTLCEYDEWLQRARCDKRSLRTVPLSYGCEHSKVLEVQDNDIKSLLLDPLSGYEAVVILDVSNNCIKSIQPGTFEQTVNLENIFLSRNKISILQNGIFKGIENRLLRFFIDGNSLTEIDVSALRGLRKLKALTLSNNLIRRIPGGTFNDLAELEYLHLSGNKLTILEYNIFSGLASVKSISLDRNYLYYLPDGLFRGLSYLTSIDLSYNRFVTISGPEGLGLSHNNFNILKLSNNDFNSTVSIIPYLSKKNLLVIVGSNPFKCDCGFLIFQKWFFNKSLEYQNVIIDKGPLDCRWKSSLIHIQSDLSATCQLSTVVTSVWNKDLQTLPRTSTT